MSNEATILLFPKLRFTEFRDGLPWESRVLGPMTLKVGSGITPTGGDKNYKATGRPFVRSQNVGWGELILDDVAYIDEEMHRSFDSTEIATSDVLLNITGASIGRSAVADSRVAGGNVNQHVCIIRTKPSELNPFLLNQYLISQNGQSQIDSFQAGGNRQGLNFSQIRSFLIPLSKALFEQQRIADCLSSLDELIAAQARKVDALKTHKKGLMQQLFPIEGETQPRLRFPEFRDAGDWEVRALSSFSKVGDIDHKMPSSVIDGIPYIMTGNFFGMNGIDFDNAKKVSVEDYEQLVKKIKPEFGDIVIARYASVGAVRYIETKSKFLVSYSCAVVKCNRSEDSKYLYYILQSDVIQSKIGLEINASSQKNIGIDSIKRLNIFLPTLPEQQKIADCLTTLDVLITTSTQELENLKTHKKALMQQLFPSVQEVAA
ncbi:MAG: hypothetical protein RLZZ573_1652 [Pseudomonadota bacterium]|jgi:type I restriction enzyme S subunit